MSATSVDRNPLAPRTVIELPMAVRATIPALMVLCCALLAGAAPIGVSIVAVFLFAGPHNWLEARYFLTRMPARWGPLASYFSLGIGGTLVMGGMFAAMPWLAGEYSQTGLLLVAVWNTLLTVWIVSLALLRSWQNPRRDWRLLVPVGFGFIAVNWLWPLAWSLALVYVHPLMALWFLDRELKRQRSPWHKPCRLALLIVPGCLIGLAMRFAGVPDLAERDVVSWQITQHAGASVIPQVSTHLLVASHVFLELLHYIVWIVVIPSVSVRNPVWQMNNIPLARRSLNWRRFVASIVIVGACIIVLLLGAFLTDYAWTRDVYFTVAILHVLGEVPFLLRLL